METVLKLRSMGKDSHVVVSFVINNGYTLPFMVALSTLLRCANAKHFYDIVVLETDLTAINKNRIQQLVSCPPSSCNNEDVEFSLRFVNIGDRVKELQRKWSITFKAVYHRLLVPEVFSQYEKVLVLDADIVINRDVAELYQIKLNDNEWVGAVIDTVVGLYERTDHPNFSTAGVRKWLDNPLEYCNGGVVLYNVMACRKNKLMDKFIQQHAVMGPTKWHEQDLLNVCCQNHIHFLNPKWNVEAPSFDAHFAKLAAKGFDVHDEREEHHGNREHPYILHWVGGRKPWRDPSDELSAGWWKYARTLPNYEEIIYTNICELIRSEVTKKLEEHGARSVELLRGEIRKKLEECEAQSTELLRGEIKIKMEGQGRKERQLADCLGLLEARQRTADRVMSARLSAVEYAVQKVRSDVREVVLLPFTWINLQRCRIASHILGGGIGQHYVKKKRQLRTRVRTALDFIRTTPWKNDGKVPITINKG